MRKFGLVVAFVLGLIGLGATPSLAQSAADVPVCAGVSLTSPADGAVLREDDYRVKFTWSGEPKGTASREWVSIRIDADKNGNFSIAEGTHAKADKGAYKAFARGRPGIYTWFVIFHDAKGKIICMSKTRKYVIGDQTFASLSGGIEGSVTVTVVKGRYVIVLTGRRGTNNDYGGSAPINRLVLSNDYNDVTDHDTWEAQGYSGLEIWGNDQSNLIVGSNKSDLIYGLEGNDGIAGRGGDDTINGGNESCFILCVAGDAISGGDGNDTINGGDESCTFLCIAGDAISGDDGSDTINGGNETCAVLCVAAGDAITGNFPGNAEDGDKDVVNGQGGNDIVAGTGADVVTP